MVCTLFGKVLFYNLFQCFFWEEERRGQVGCGNGVCMEVHFSDVEWLGNIEGVCGMEVGHVCAVGVEWL